MGISSNSWHHYDSRQPGKTRSQARNLKNLQVTSKLVMQTPILSRKLDQFHKNGLAALAGAVRDCMGFLAVSVRLVRAEGIPVWDQGSADEVAIVVMKSERGFMSEVLNKDLEPHLR